MPCRRIPRPSCVVSRALPGFAVRARDSAGEMRRSWVLGRACASCWACPDTRETIRAVSLPQPRRAPGFVRRSPSAAGGRNAGLVHASGRGGPARVLGRCGRAWVHAGGLHHAGPGRGDHPAAGPSLRGRRGDPVLLDIVVPLRAVGIDLDIVSGVGPVVARPIRDWPDLDRLRAVGARRRRAGSRPRCGNWWWSSWGGTPLIGFAGAPFTLGVASTWIEGGPSRTHELTKAMMLGNPEAVGGPAGPARRHHHDVSCGSRSRPAPAPSIFSTAGRAPCRRVDYSAVGVPRPAPEVFAAVADLGRPADPLRGDDRGTAAGDG